LQLAENLAKGLKNEPAFKQAKNLLLELNHQASPTAAHPTSPSLVVTNDTSETSDIDALDIQATLNPDALLSVDQEDAEVAHLRFRFESIDDVLKKTAEFLNETRERDALQLIDGTLASQPSWTGLFYARAIVLSRLGRRNEARATLQQLPTNERTNAKVQRLLRELDEDSQRLKAV
jgi:thioredoxin-like negative regulator of GroEL